MRKLGTLRGIAIIAVVFSHTAAYGMMILSWWGNRFGETSPPPDWSWVTTPTGYGLSSMSDLTLFAVPIFLFASGYSIIYVAQSHSSSLSLKIVGQQVRTLLTPFAVWMAISVLLYVLTVGLLHVRDESASTLGFLWERASDYYYVLVLAELIVISPVLIRLATRFPKWLLVVSGAVQGATMALQYASVVGVTVALWLHVDSWAWLNCGAWVFYYTLGILVARHNKAIRQQLLLVQWPLCFAAIAFGLASIGETEILRGLYHRYSTIMQWKFTTFGYATLVILALVTWDLPRGRLSRVLDGLGTRSYGIYLVQAIVLADIARLAYHATPFLLPKQLVFQPLLIGAGIGVPVTLILIVSHLPLRRYQYQLFGCHVGQSRRLVGLARVEVTQPVNV